MSYYVTLPSNGADLESDYGKENNTLTDFEIELKEPLEFPLGNYEVGLAEFSYRKTWTCKLGWFSVLTNTSKNLQDEHIFKDELIDILDGLSMKRVIRRINDVIQDYDSSGYISKVYTEKPYLKYFPDGKLEIHVPLGLKLIIDGYFVEMIRHRSFRPTFYKTLSTNQEKDEFMNNNVVFENNRRLVIAGHHKLNSEYLVKNSRIKYIENLFLYTDIINEVHVGSEMLKLLKVIPVKARYDELVSETFYFPHYVDLDSMYIDRIRLYLCDSEGNKIKFTDEHSKVIYKLHFRPKKTL